MIIEGYFSYSSLKLYILTRHLNHTESCDVRLVTINRQTSYDSGILRQGYGNIRGLPIGSTRNTASGQTVRALLL